jgi:hypothetical protein
MADRPAALVAPAQESRHGRARSTSGEAVVARRAAARAEGMEPQIPKILTAVVVIWIVSGTALHFAERGTTPAYETWRGPSGASGSPSSAASAKRGPFPGGSSCPACLSSASP